MRDLKIHGLQRACRNWLPQNCRRYDRHPCISQLTQDHPYDNHKLRAQLYLHRDLLEQARVWISPIYVGKTIMREHMSKEAYLDHCRLTIVQTAADMLDGHVGFLIGSRKLRSLLIELGLKLLDPELMVFTAIDSETDALLLGDVRQHWDEGALRRLEPEIQDAERWARDVGSPACVALIRRFEEGPPPMASISPSIGTSSSIGITLNSK